MADVMDAFLRLFEEIEEEIDAVKQSILNGVASEHFEEVEKASQRAGQMKDILWRIVPLGQEWNTLFSLKEEKEEQDTERRDLGRLRRGLRTKEEAYYRPILEILKDLGGSARIGQVFERIPQEMTEILQEVDFKTLPSDSSSPRWRNTARFARLTLVKRGLLRDDSRRGTWEITKAGSDWLDSNDKEILRWTGQDTPTDQ